MSLILFLRLHENLPLICVIGLEGRNKFQLAPNLVPNGASFSSVNGIKPTAHLNKNQSCAITGNSQEALIHSKAVGRMACRIGHENEKSEEVPLAAACCLHLLDNL